ncbi:MAG: hypothetical protein KJ736_08020 [Candidatus Omnitrophica bacterium]|nr:hypothetical protein [Candidatus Omnitrophota bacterium]
MKDKIKAYILETDDFTSETQIERWQQKVATFLREALNLKNSDDFRALQLGVNNFDDLSRQLGFLDALSLEIERASNKTSSEGIKTIEGIVNNQELIKLIEKLKNIMVSVSTGGQRIQDVKSEYQQTYGEVDIQLRNCKLKNPNSYSDLWEWYGRWSNGDLPSYQSRRQFLAEMFNPILQELRNRVAGKQPAILQEPTGWTRVDRTIGEIRSRLASAKTEEQYQAIGLLCRDGLISLAQSVYDPVRHPSMDGTQPSQTDAKRMLENYITSVLSGSSNEAARKHAKAAYELANDLQHRRTATFRQATLCTEATASIINVIAIISGRYDPE